ncbi:vitamin K epoxide reductase family protein [Cellulomonas soli]
MARTTTDDAIDDDGALDVQVHDTDLADDALDDDPDLLRPAPLAWRRRTAVEMVVSGLIGIYASFVLSIEALTLAADPDADLSCNLSNVISCGKVGSSWQAQLLGFPNAFLGIAAEAVVITVAVALIGGVLFPRWFMLAAQTIYTIGLAFAYWLFYESATDIGALCPWCLLITVTTTLVWAGLTRINVRDGNLRLPGAAGPAARRFVAAGNDWFVTVAVLVLFVAVLVVKYGPSLLS